MKFYGQGKVWDKENKRILCEFVNGEFVTTDERIINILTELKFRCEAPLPINIELGKTKRKKKND